MSDPAEDMLLAELDCGNDPPGALVVREIMWTRVAGKFLCLMLAAPSAVILLLRIVSFCLTSICQFHACSNVSSRP